MIKRIYLIIFTSQICFSQTIHLSRAEKCWAVLHPFAALKIRKIQKQIAPLYHPAQLKAELDSFANGGKLDAFRHTFFMSAFAQKVKVKKLRRLGIAHERSNYKNFLKSETEDGELADSIACQMDLINNELGFRIGKLNKKITHEELKKLVIVELNSGKGTIVKRNKKGQYLDKNERPLNLTLYKRTWNIPKNLASSDYIYKD